MVDRVNGEMQRATRGYMLAPIIRDRKRRVSQDSWICVSKGLSAGNKVGRPILMNWTKPPTLDKNSVP